MKKYWFKNRKVGIGWSPASWQGWLVIGLYIVAVTQLIAFTKFETLTGNTLVADFFAPFAAITFLLLIIAWRTGEPLDFKFWNK